MKNRMTNPMRPITHETDRSRTRAIDSLSSGRLPSIVHRRGASALLLAAVLLAPGGAAAAASDAAPAAPPPAPAALPTIGVDELTPGQRGYGLTVFAGREPERFEAEVVGVMRNTTPETSYILARLTGHGLEESGVAGGMSGSPVYFDGRLAGAVAFSWPFSHEAIAGITPIDAMRRIPALPLPGAPPPGVGPAPVPAEPASSGRASGAERRASGSPPVQAPGVTPSIRVSGADSRRAAGVESRPAVGRSPVSALDLAARRLPAGLLERELAKLAPRLPGGALSGIQWSAAGFGPASEGLLRTALGTLAPAGEAAPGIAADGLVPGSPVSAVLIDGDFRMAGTGTVTDVTGDGVLAFGHSMLGLGPLSVPMAAAEVVTVLSSRFSSFKISNVGPVIGAIEQDRQAGLRGRLGAAAPTIPLTLVVDGAERREFHMRLAAVPQITPALIAISSLAGLEAASYSGGLQGLDLEARFRLAGRDELTVAQSFDGDAAGSRAALHLVSYAAFLLQNEMEEVALEGIEIELRQSGEPRTATLVGAHAERTVLRPGDQVAVHLEFTAWRGEPFRRTLELTLPANLPAGRYHLFVGDGASVDAARLAVERAEPQTLRQALALLGSLHSNRELVVLGVREAHGLAVAGEVLPQLPGTVRSIWGAAGPGGAQPLRLAVAQTEAVAMPVPIQGLLRVDLRIERREPLTAGEIDGEAPAEDMDGQAVEGGGPTGTGNGEGAR
jgi:hypothetical protein